MNSNVPRDHLSRGAALTAMFAIVAYQVVLVALIFVRPDLDPSWHTVSEWAIGPHGWIMSMAFVVSGLSYAAMFALITPHVRGVGGRIGVGMLAICAIGAVGVGFFTTDPLGTPPSQLSTIGRLHVVCGSSQLVLLPFAALLITLNLALKNGSWSSARRALFAIAAVPLLGFLGFTVYTALFVVPLGPGAYGPGVHIGWPPRVAFFTYAVWVVALASQALRLRRSAPRALFDRVAP